MAQVIRKLANGDKAPEVSTEKMFKDGSREISLTLLQKDANYRINDYINSRGWSRKKALAFRNAYSDIMSSISNGSITERDASRKYIDSTGKILNSQGKGFDAYGEAAYFLDTIIDKMPDYKSTEDKKKKKYSSSDLLTSFSNKFFGGADPDLVIWLGRDTKDESGKYGTTNRATAFADWLDEYANSLSDDYDYEDTAFSGRDDLLTRLKNASTELRNGTFDNNDYIALTSLGIPGEAARKLFSTDKVTDSKDSKTESSGNPEYDEALASLQDAVKKDLLQEVIDAWKNRLLQELINLLLALKWYEPYKNFTAQSIVLPQTRYAQSNYDREYSKNADKWFKALGLYMYKNSPFNTNNLNVPFTVYGADTKPGMMGLRMQDPVKTNYLGYLYTQFDYLNSRNLLLELTDDKYKGYKYSDYFINENDGTVLLYNPSTRTLMREVVYKVPDLRARIEADAISKIQTGNPFDIASLKNGGVIQKRLFGGNLNYLDKIITLINLQEKLNSTKNKKTKEEDSPKEEKAGSRVVGGDNSFTATDWARIGAAAADVASIVSAFAPGYGTAISAGTGLASSAATFGADIAEDGFQLKDLGNLATNIGMDVVGLIPGFGAAGKTSKIVKNLVKYVPRLITLGAAAGVTPKALASIKKIGTDEELTVDDWRNILDGLSVIAGLSRIGASAMKTRAMKKQFSTGDKTITTKSSKLVRVTPEELEKILKAKSLEDANKILQNTKSGLGKGEELASTFRKWYNPTKLWNNNPRVGEHFLFTPEYNTKGLPISNPLRDYNIYRGMVESNWNPIPSWHWNIHFPNIKNPYKVRTTPSSLNIGLPSPRRIRLREKGFTDEDLDNRGIYKQGGRIVKAQSGVDTSIFADLKELNLDTDFSTSWATDRLVNGLMGDGHLDPWISDVAGLGTGRYLPTTGNTKEYTLNVENQLYYKDFGKALFNPDGTLSDVGVAWTKAVDRYLPKESLASFYDENGNLRTSWTVKNLDVYGRNPHTFNNIKDYIDYVRNDLILGARHNVFLKRGNRYYWKDQLGNKHYVNPEDLSKYRLGNTEIVKNPDGTITWHDLELLGLKDPTNPALNPDNRSKLEGNTIPTSPKPNIGNLVLDATLDIMDLGLLRAHIRNTNKVADLARVHPVLRNTYHLERVNTGDLASKLNYHNQAAKLESFASKPRTSDASLQLAGLLDAKVKADEYRMKGDMIDNAALEQDIEKSWLTASDNIARATETANYNRAAIAAADLANRNIEAGRRSANLTSIANYIKGLQYKWNLNREKLRTFDMSVALQGLNNFLLKELQGLQGLWRTIANSDVDDYTTLPEYLQYVDRSLDIYNRYLDNYNKAYSSIYGLRYNPVTFYKKGGEVEVAKIKARTASAKLFQDHIKEYTRNNLKMINNLSSLTSKLILKAMGV